MGLNMSRQMKFINRIDSDDGTAVCDYLASETGLSKSKIKAAMIKGAVHIKRKGRGRKRIRRATTPLRLGDRIELYYDADILSIQPPAARCLSDHPHYSVWFKPAGLMTQGTAYGDHCALVRQAQQHFGRHRSVFPVHRLDREASGLVLVAHSRDAAAELSKLFRQHDIEKRYLTTVSGRVGHVASTGSIERPLDGRPAVTIYSVVSFDSEKNRSILKIRTLSGRKHQIRRHLAFVGHPVIGDPLYGSGNKSSAGLHLCAIRLSFFCPYRQRRVVFDLKNLLPGHHCNVCG